MFDVEKFFRSLAHVGSLALLGTACNGSDDAKSTDYMCYAMWSGEVPAAETLTIRACITEGLCSEGIGSRYAEGNAPEERDEAQETACMSNPGLCGGSASGVISVPPAMGIARWSAGWFDQSIATPSIEDESLAFGVTLEFEPSLAATLDEAARSRLMVRGDDATLVDAIALEPYAEVKEPHDDNAPTCKIAHVNLDGSAREP